MADNSKFSGICFYFWPGFLFQPRDAAHPWYHGLENDYVMYSILNTVKYETPTQVAKEQPIDMMCMFDDISYLDNIPKYDQYDYDYVVEIYVDCSKNPMTFFWEKKAQLQIKYANHPFHNSYDSNEENAENIRVSERYMPLSFSSFQFLKESYKKIVNSSDGECSDESVGDVIDDIEFVLDPNLHP
jgi:hypothetical protein